MNEENVRKRDWVKNAAIVFLAVLLVLTFFSNTIMNRSLPEVAARYTSSGTINARIRGTATVTANNSYEVKMEQTRTISSVNVRLGNQVETGDILFTLADSESTQLSSAREELRRLTLEYERAVINASLDGDYSSQERSIRLANEKLEELEANKIEAVQKGEEEIAKAKEELEIARLTLDSAEDELRRLETRYATAEGSRDTAQEQVKLAQTKLTTATEAVADAQRYLSELGGLNSGSDTSDVNRRINNKNEEISNKIAEINVAKIMHQSNYDDFVTDAFDHFSTMELSDPSDPSSPLVLTPPEAWDDMVRRAAYLAAYGQFYVDSSSTADPNYIAYSTLTKLDGELSKLEDDLLQLERERNGLLGGNNSYEHERRTRMLENAQTAERNAKSDLTKATEALEDLETALAAVKKDRDEALTDRDKAKTEFTAAENELKLKEENLLTIQRQADDAIKSQEMSIDELLFNLSEQQKKDGIASELQSLNMAEQRNQISIKRSEIAKLESDGTGAVVTSPVSGIIRAINISAGDQTQPGSTLITIELTDRGYSMSIPVTLEQSRQVAIGDIAELDRYSYWGGDLRIILSTIRNDPQNPVNGRILVFDVSGNVESGTSLSISIGQRSQNYPTIVPNSALRSDTNGDFVLVIETNRSPLGNRYVATRVDVNIIASDDTQSAVSGALDRSNYVITTANRPIEPGMQVRFIN
ncbi:MAG: hypothetical protein FWG88_01970 [Oscillospiraceae bacterium]|nr:hypothetical protein [Oscillospiraceae bacterium]